jgi:hypothetical protein
LTRPVRRDARRSNMGIQCTPDLVAGPGPAERDSENPPAASSADTACARAAGPPSDGVPGGSSGGGGAIPQQPSTMTSP